MLLHLLQHTIVWEDRAATLAHVRELLRAHPPARDSLLVLPEMFATGFSMNPARTAEPAGHAIQQLAQDFHCAVLAGTTEFPPANDPPPHTQHSPVVPSIPRAQNLAYAYAPDGTLLARYAKLHPFSFGREIHHYAPGTALACFEWQSLRITPFICYDLRFPEAFRAAIRRDRPHLFCVLANWPADRIAHWDALVVARAIENQAAVAAVNRTGADPYLPYPGHSVILTPQGTPLAQACDEETLLTAKITADSIDACRRHFPALADMRTDL